jgi:uncharacterized repeat protein (TIGR02543 family)
MSLKKTWRKLFVLAIAGFLFFGTACTALESISSESNLGTKVYFTVTFDSNGGTIVDSQQVEGGRKATQPDEPTRTGYTFDGWYINGDERWVFGGYDVTENITLIAQWTANDYTITLDLNGGTLEGPTSFAVTYDQAYTLPTPTSSEGPFNGWYLDEVKFTDKFGVSLTNYDQTNDITLKAVFYIDYIEIYTAEDLIAINNDLGASYRLKNDIDLGGVEWIPLGNNLTPFTGIFDGQWYTISGINITTSQTYIGLFGYNEGTLKNIVLDQLTINVTGAVEQNLYGAGLVGYNKGLIDDITNLTGNIYIKARGGANAYVGGIVGYQNTSIELSYLHNDFMIEGDLATSVGGLVGEGFTTTISGSYNSGAVSGSYLVGGLVGYGDTATISSSYNSGAVSGSAQVGGLVGYGNTTTISGSYNSGSVSGGFYVGGLVGYGGSRGTTTTISSSYNSGSVSGSYYVGGLVGFGSYTTIISSYNSGSVSGSDQVGGLVGYGYTITISSSYNSGAVSGSDNYVGGLVGYGSYTTTISGSYNSGAVSGSGNVGGLVGVGFATISGSYNSGSVSGIDQVGGLVGYGSNATISGSYNSGSVSGITYVGGLVGYEQTAIYIYYSLNFGDVTTSDSTSNIGGIYGYSRAIGDQEHVYYTGLLTAAGVEVAGIDFGVKVNDLSIFNQDFFVTTLGWDIEMWDFTNLDIANEVYPNLMI